MSTIVFTGVKGVGKSTLVKQVATLLCQPSADYADFMLEVTGLKDKSLLGLMSVEERAKAIEAVSELFKERLRKQENRLTCLLLTNHLTVIQDGKITAPARRVHQALGMLALGVIIASPQDILDRRAGDSSQARPTDSKSLIRQQQRANAIEANAIASTYRIPLRFFRNPTDLMPIEDVLGWVKSVMGERMRVCDENI